MERQKPTHARSDGSQQQQKLTSIEFWDRYYHNHESITEWILRDSQSLLALISSQLMTSSNLQRGTKKILEIGCGTSCLARSLLQHLVDRRQNGEAKGNCGYSVKATDVSDVCIQQNRARDSAYINSLGGGVDELRYDKLDVLGHDLGCGADSCKYDIIIDKGCLDTFLFRNARKDKRTESHPPLLVCLLTNVYRLLKNGSGRYIFVSPRSKIPSVRDFAGFAEVKRVAMYGSGDLDGKRRQPEESKWRKSHLAYVYICVKGGPIEIDNEGSLFHDTYDTSLSNDQDTCPKCAISFGDFREGRDITQKGELVWGRIWKGHKTHCKG